LNQILEPAAADRLGRIRLVKESRAADVENRLITLARSGQLRQKVTEEQLKELLNAMADTKEEEKIVIRRRKGSWGDDEDDLLDL
jgi:programmed cell death protein 5